LKRYSYHSQGWDVQGQISTMEEDHIDKMDGAMIQTPIYNQTRKHDNRTQL
jgi:hypothetical protein